MNIKLSELVKNSNFKRYYFIIDAKEFEEGTITSGEISLKKTKALVEFMFYDAEETSLGWKYYDLGRCLHINSKNAETIAYWIEKSKLFDFEKLEINFENQTAYFHLTRRQL